MSKIDELIKKLCPNGVMFQYLGDICEIKTGKGLTKSDTKEDGEFPIISGGVLPLGYYEDYNRDAGNVTIARAGNAGYVNYITTPFWCNDKCFSVIPLKNNYINKKYMYYFLKNKEEKIMSLKSTGTVPTVNTEKVSKIKIAVPPLEVQDEIVHILDDFTLLSAELSAELKARNKQYQYYKNKLFDFDDSVKKIAFGDLCDLVTKQTGFDYTKTIKDSLVRENKEGTLPYIQTKFFTGKNFEYDTDYFIPLSVAEKFPKILLDQKAILLSIVGASIGNVGLFNGKRKSFLGGAICVAKVCEKYNIDYIYYYLTSHFGQKQIFNKVKGAGQATVTIEDIRNFLIPMPSLEEQNKIVEILNRLDQITNDINKGLPAEINARQKQYEYFRDKLLTFKELVNEG